MENNNIEVVNHDSCVGCGACVSVCPKACITMQANNGFYYPKIDSNRCVQCGRCLKACGVSDRILPFNKPIEWFAGYISKDMSPHSTSGEICTELSSQYIKSGNSVYAAAFDAEWNLVTRKVNDIGELEAFSGSKYVQSIIPKETFLAIEHDLKDEKRCLFIGTPCQVAAVKKYLLLKKVDTVRLTTVDFMCHGVPSPILCKSFIKNLDAKQGINYYNFRSKKFGWGALDRTIELRNGKSNTISANICPLHSWFGHHLSIRESCFACAYRKKERISDITVADFWNIEKYYPDIPKKQGISAIQINTEKGKEEYHSMSKKCHMFSQNVSEESVWDRKTALNNFLKPMSYEAFWNDAKNLSVKDLSKKYPPQSKFGYIKEYLKLFLRRIKNG